MRYTLITLLGFFLLTSCTKFLEEKVDNRTLVNTLDDIEKAVNYLAPRADYIFTDIMTDDYSYKNIARHLNNSARDKLRPIFQFAINKQSFSKNAFLSSGFNPYLAWRRYYYRINNCYFLLDRLSNYDSQSKEEEERANKIKAQCLAIKAYCNFMLVNLFARQYEEDTASEDLGPPYVDKYSTESVTIFNRVSVKEYYDHIEANLKKALEYLDDNRVNKLYFNDLAVKALLSRVYLYKGDYDNCIKYTKEVLDENNKILNIKGLIQTYVEKNKLEEYSKQYFNPSQEGYILVSDDTYQLMSFFWHGYYPYPIQNFASNKGFSFYAIRTSPLFNDIIADKWLYFIHKGSQRLQIMMPLFTVAEMKCNLAEAYIYKSDFDKAKDLIKDVIDSDSYSSKPDVDAIAANEKDMIDLLLDTKRLRFFCEGMRWFDLKRYKLPISHNIDGNVFEIKGTSPDEYVIQPPSEEISFRTDYNN